MKKIKQKYFIKNKKAVSQIISWVLLIGLTISIAIFVTKWTLDQAKQTTEGVTKLVTEDVRCSSVALNAVRDCSNENSILLKISNKGTLTIRGLIIRKYSGTQVQKIEESIEILPQQTTDLNIGTNYDKIEIIPKIKVDKEEIGCSDRIISLTQELLIC